MGRSCLLVWLAWLRQGEQDCEVFQMSMRTRRRALAGWFLVGFIMACGVGMAMGDEAPSPPSIASALLSRYPQIGPGVVESHVNADWNLKK